MVDGKSTILGVTRGLGVVMDSGRRPAGQEGGVRQVGVHLWGTECQTESWAGSCRQWKPADRAVIGVCSHKTSPGRFVCDGPGHWDQRAAGATCLWGPHLF